MAEEVSSAALQPIVLPQPPRLLDFGEAAPGFHAPALSGNPDYSFDSAAGRLIVLLFLGSGGWGPAAEALALLARNARLFDDDNASFFGVTVDPSDAAEQRIAQRIPGIRWFLDYDAAVSRLYGAAYKQGEHNGYAPFWLLLDPTMRVITRAPLSQGERIFALLRGMIAAGPEQTNAPVLTVPRVFEPELCRELIRLYAEKGGKDSGFMRTRDGKTVAVLDHSFKRRSDYVIEDDGLRALLLDRIVRRLTPQIERAFQYRPTRMERWMIACYDGETGGFFRPHRDNTTAGTAHRVFACTINLNAEDYEGGELRFPEYGQRTYRALSGGAVVFSCGLLHEATPVTRGRRYAFLPFFYDEEKARLRERNQVHFAEGNGGYRASPVGGTAGLAPKGAPQP
jgi:predicted 2-oxoglutarate/Fe(II)-dependent dioxygenase YbiX/peroxiredoxin